MKTIKNLTDKNIVLLLRQHSFDKAFDLIVEQYHQKLYWHIRRIVLSHDDANDVLQNTFMKIWKALPKFRGDSKVYTWLFRIATNESITFINKKKKHLSFDDVSGEIPSPHQLGIDFTASEIEQKLEMAIASLPEKQRVVFNLRYYEEMKYSDISEVTGTSVGGLKANYHIAVKKIEDYLTS